MLNSDDLSFFIAVAAAPSQAAVARELNVSPSAVTQRLRSLELRLGVRLLDRAGRGHALTDEGEMLVERGRAILTELGDLNDNLAARHHEVIGHLRIVAPFGFGRRYVAPVVAAFQATHPRVTADLTLSDKLSGVPAGNWDIAIQVGPPEGVAASLIVRGLAPNRRFLCAAPSYLAQKGVPQTPHDLLKHDCLAIRENSEDVNLWRFREAVDGAEMPVRIRPPLTSNDGEVVRNWVLAGRGLTVRSEWDVAAELRLGLLVRVLPNFTLPDAPVVSLFGSARQARAARSDRFMNALRLSLSPTPWRETGDVEA